MCFWIDINEKSYDKDEVTDKHLLNIINHIAKGGGWLHFLSDDKIDDIYDEALFRGLKTRYTRSDCKNGYRDRLKSEVK